jgi:hypothetical protein
MAPVATAVTYAYEYGHIALFRLNESLLAPGIPVNGVIRVLKKIRGFLVN